MQLRTVVNHLAARVYLTDAISKLTRKGDETIA